MDTMTQDVSLLMTCVKQEPECESTHLEANEAAASDLYIKHEVQDNLVIGPEGLQPGDAAFAVRGSLQCPDTDEPAYLSIHREQIFTDSQAKQELKTSLMCGICGKTYKTKSMLTCHTKFHQQRGIQKRDTTENSTPKYSCQLCAKIFKSVKRLSSHECLQKEVCYRCDVCNKEFAKKTGLGRHMLSHMEKSAPNRGAKRSEQERKIPKTDAERSKEYREKLKIKKLTEQGRKIPKSAAQRAMEYREKRKKKLAELLLNNEHTEDTTSIDRRRCRSEYLKEYRRKIKLKQKCLQLNALLVNHCEVKTEETANLPQEKDFKASCSPNKIEQRSHAIHNDPEYIRDEHMETEDNDNIDSDIDINVTIPMYTDYYQHASCHVQFYKGFRRNSFGHACAVCDRLWCKNDLKNITHDILNLIVPNNGSGTSVAVCHTCKKSIDKGNIPLLSTYNGFTFPELPPLPKLNLIEKRLISPRIPFTQIRRLGNLNDDIYGQIINVPLDLNTAVDELPRDINNDHSFNVNVEKKSIFTTDQVQRLINKEHIEQWLKYLVKTPLYIQENTKINESILNSYQTDQTEFNDDIVDYTDDNFTPQQTLMLNEETLQMGPVEKRVFDKYAEELAFPTVYGGQFRTYKECNVTNLQQANSELKRKDRRAADPEHILYVASKIMKQRLTNSVNIAFKHVGYKTQITKEDILSENYLNSCIESYFVFLRCIPNSLWYWADQKNILLSMIRQFGIPTAVIKLSFNETWTDLLKLLYKLNEGIEIDDKFVDEMCYVNKAKLVNDDAVTCVIYYNNLVNCLLKILQAKKGSPFGKYRVKYYHKRIEFDDNGYPKACILLWLENVSELNSKDFYGMVDKLISVSEKEASGNIKLQTHNHSSCCNKIYSNKESCNFEAPFLPLRETITLTPMEDNENEEKIKEYKTHYESIRANLEYNNYDDIDHFYTENNIETDEHYYNIIRAGIVRPKLLYKRAPSEKWHNALNPFIFHHLQSKIEFQIILDESDCAPYVLDYVSKQSVSEFKRHLIQIMNDPDCNVIDITNKLSIDLVNTVEMSVQEAAWYLLCEPMAKTSVVTAYIPTIYPTERQTIRKSLKEMNDLENEQEDWFYKYEKRPDSLENVTLAQFVANYNVSKNGQWCKRKVPRVIRYRNYDINKNFNDHTREMVLLHIPFRSEEKDVLGDFKFFKIYEDNKYLVLERRKEFEFNPDIEKTLEIFKQLSRDTYLQKGT